jgi:hypothetical protein
MEKSKEDIHDELDSDPNSFSKEESDFFPVHLSISLAFGSIGDLEYILFIL